MHNKRMHWFALLLFISISNPMLAGAKQFLKDSLTFLSDCAVSLRDHCIEHGEGKKSAEVLALVTGNNPACVENSMKSSLSTEEIGKLNTQLTEINNSIKENPSLQRIADSLTVIKYLSAGAVGLYALKRVANASWCIKSYVWPSDEDKLRKIESAHRLQLFRTQVKFNEYLVRYANAQKDSTGLPVPCRPIADEYAKLAGPEALQKMIDEFKQCCHLFC